MPSYFPALPQPYSVLHPDRYLQDQPVNALAQGLNTGLTLSSNMMKNEEAMRKLDQEVETEEALRRYAETGQIAPVMQANPKFGLALQKETRQAETDRAKNEREMLVKAVEYADKALPYFATDPGPERWNLFRQHMTKLGVGHLVDSQWNEENVNKLIQLKRDYAGRLGLEDRLALQEDKYSRIAELETLKGDIRASIKAMGGGSGKGGKGGSLDKTLDERIATTLQEADPNLSRADALTQAIEMRKTPYAGTRAIHEATIPQKELATEKATQELESELDFGLRLENSKRKRAGQPELTKDQFKAERGIRPRAGAVVQPAQPAAVQPTGVVPQGMRAMKDKAGNRVLITEQEYQAWKAKQAGTR